MKLTLDEPRVQDDLASTPYDSWVGPSDEILTEFHRTRSGFLMRFDGLADFAIDRENLGVVCTPAPDCDQAMLDRTIHNAIGPVIANHCGRLSLHGSAVLIDGMTVVFMGASRRGKTTLAGAFAKEGHPFLTEDWVELTQDGGEYSVLSKRPHLRVFSDSAAYLQGHPADLQDGDGKVELAAGSMLPHTQGSHPLRAICILGGGDTEQCVLELIDPAAALIDLIPSAFVLDSHDKDRMRAHFGRLGALAANASCFALDYPRRFDMLPGVISKIRKSLGKS